VDFPSDAVQIDVVHQWKFLGKETKVKYNFIGQLPTGQPNRKTAN